MDKIPKQHIDFLEFVTKKIYAEDPGQWSLELLAEEYNEKYSIELKINDVRHIAALYKNKYFTTSSKSDLQIFPKSEIKQEFENHGSLSGFLRYKSKRSKQHKRWENAKSVAPIIISSISVVVAIIFGILNFKLNNNVKKLKTELNKKDSIIFELNKQLIKNDTIKTKQ